MNLQLLTCASAQVETRDVIGVGVAVVVMLLALLSALYTGKIPLRLGLPADRQKSPVEFWGVFVVLCCGTLVIIAAFLFVLTGWLGWWPK